MDDTRKYWLFGLGGDIGPILLASVTFDELRDSFGDFDQNKSLTVLEYVRAGYQVRAFPFWIIPEPISGEEVELDGSWASEEQRIAMAARFIALSKE